VTANVALPLGVSLMVGGWRPAAPPGFGWRCASIRHGPKGAVPTASS